MTQETDKCSETTDKAPIYTDKKNVEVPGTRALGEEINSQVERDKQKEPGGFTRFFLFVLWFKRL